MVISLALLSNPKILLLDEPFAALDIMTIKNLQQIIVDLQTQNNISIILCDHQARDLLTCVDLAIVLSNSVVSSTLYLAPAAKLPLKSSADGTLTTFLLSIS